MFKNFTRKFVVILLTFSCCIASFAQQRIVTGVVTDQETKQPIIGVTVGVKGSNRSTTTNEKGQFSINVSGNETVLKFTYVGFAYQEFIVGSKSSFNVSLSKDTKQ